MEGNAECRIIHQSFPKAASLLLGEHKINTKVARSDSTFSKKHPESHSFVALAPVIVLDTAVDEVQVLDPCLPSKPDTVPEKRHEEDYGQLVGPLLEECDSDVESLHLELLDVPDYFPVSEGPSVIELHEPSQELASLQGWILRWVRQAQRT